MSTAKGFFGGVFVTAPVTLAIAYLAFGQTERVEARLDRMETKQELAREEANASFDAAWHSMTGAKIDACTPERSAQIAALRAALKSLDQRLDTENALSQETREDLRRAIEAMEAK